MAKTYISHSKYVIHQEFEIKGVVDKHDIIGAIFGQSEGIVGDELDLRELQASGKIGRIEIDAESRNGVTRGILTIPSGTDMVETSILAATIEVVDKVGPCDASFKTLKIEDMRSSKRKIVIDRAKELLLRLVNEEIPDSLEIANEVRSEVRTSEVVSFGVDNLPAGPGIKDSEEIILVEGRADVINMLKCNFKNVIAIGGSNITKTIIDLCKSKTVTAFMDGDRGGDLDLKKLIQTADIDFAAKAPQGKEVEELTKKEILACLQKRVPISQDTNPEPTVIQNDISNFEPKVEFRSKTINGFNNHKRYDKYVPRVVQNTQESVNLEQKVLEPSVNVDDKYSQIMSQLKDSSRFRFYDESSNLICESDVKDILHHLKDKKNISFVVFDGIISKRLAELGKSKGVKTIVGVKKGKMAPIKGIELLEA